MATVSRRGLLKSGVAVAAGGLLGVASVPAIRELTKVRPSANIVLVVLDALRADHLRCYGYSRATSPHIDALAAEATLYARNKSQAALTTASMACIFTSRTITEHFVPPTLPSLPAILQSAGFHTAAVQANPWLVEKRGFTRGFDSYRMLLPEGGATELLDWEEKTADKNVFYADAAVVAAAACDQIAAAAGRPFFLYVHLMDAHGPYIPKDEFDAFSSTKRPFAEKLRLSTDFMAAGPDAPGRVAALKDDIIALYDGGIRQADHAVGEIVTFLKHRALYTDTAVVVTADHGEQFGEHGRTQHVGSLFDAVLHTPLIVKSPRSVLAARRWFLTSNADITPTIMTMAGFRPRHIAPYGFEGRALSAVTDEFAELATASMIANDLKDGFFAVEKEGFKLMVEGRVDDLVAGRPARVMLFNLAKDPGETTNLSSALPDKVRELFPLLARYPSRKLSAADIEKSISPEERARLKSLGYLN